MYFTRQDHIDRMISSVDPCPMPQIIGRRSRDTRVLFTNNSWACSSGHVSSDAEPPSLRTPERDPIEWIKTHSGQLALSIRVTPCEAHVGTIGDVTFDMTWGMEGHLYTISSEHKSKLSLCLPMAGLGAI